LSGKFYPPPPLPSDPKDQIRVDEFGTDRVTDTRFLRSHVMAYHKNIDIIDNQQYRDCIDEIAALPYDRALHEEQKTERLDRFVREWYRRHDAARERNRPNPAERARSAPTTNYPSMRPFHDGQYVVNQAQDDLEASLRSNVADNTSDGQSSGLPPTKDVNTDPELAASNGNNQADETPTTFPRDEGEVATTGTTYLTGLSFLAMALRKASSHPTVQGGGTADSYGGEKGGGSGVTR